MVRVQRGRYKIQLTRCGLNVQPCLPWVAVLPGQELGLYIQLCERNARRTRVSGCVILIEECPEVLILCASTVLYTLGAVVCRLPLTTA